MDLRTDEAAELEKELAANEAEISRIESELKSLKAKWSSDSVDRRLAENRARIGDIGNALAHQTKIDSRDQQNAQRKMMEMQWRWQGKMNDDARKKDEKRQREADIKALENDIFTAEISKNYAVTENERSLLDWKIHKLQEEYKKITGNYFDVGAAKNESESEGMSSGGWRKYVEDNTNNGVWNGAEAKSRFEKEWKPQSAEDSAYKKEKMNMPTKEEIDTRSKVVAAEKKEADRIADKYRMGVDYKFRNRWNKADPKDREIKILKKFYDIKDGFLVRIR